MKAGTLRVIAASIISPGLPSFAAYSIVSHWHVVLPDNFGRQVFLFYAACFYIAATPSFWILHAARRSLLAYSITGMFITWPLWMLTLLLPSDAYVCPLNPQFFDAPVTTLLGLLSGILFFWAAGNNRKIRSDTAKAGISG